MIQTTLLPIQALLWWGKYNKIKQMDYMYKNAINRIRLLEINRGRR
jgi:hypothetical protein